MRNKTWVTRHHLGIVNGIWLALLFIATGAFATVVFESSATTVQSTPVVLDETRNRIAPKPVPTTTTTTTTTTFPKRIVQPVTTQPPVIVPGDDVWTRLRNCESGGNYSTNTGNGYFGAYQFSAGTWNSMNTGYAFAHLAPPAIQDDAAMRLQARSGFGQWPACTKMMGLR